MGEGTHRSLLPEIGHRYVRYPNSTDEDSHDPGFHLLRSARCRPAGATALNCVIAPAAPARTNAALAGRSVLVTGGAGFYGINLLSCLAGIGARVVSAGRSRPAAVPDGCTWVAADLGDRAQTEALFAATRPSLVFHLTSASLGGPEMENISASVTGDLLPTLHVLEAASRCGVARVILPASMEEPFPVADADGELAVPETPYALSKLVGGLYGRFFRRAYDVPVVVLRCFLTYGPHQKPYKLIPYVIRTLHEGKAPRLSSGARPVDWIFVDDVVAALLAAATVPDAPETVLEIGTGTLRSIRDVVTMIHRLMGGPPPVFGALPNRGHARVARIAPATALLGWVPQTGLEEGLRRTIAFYTAAPPASAASSQPGVRPACAS